MCAVLCCVVLSSESKRLGYAKGNATTLPDAVHHARSSLSLYSPALAVNRITSCLLTTRETGADQTRQRKSQTHWAVLRSTGNGMPWGFEQAQFFSSFLNFYRTRLLFFYLSLSLLPRVKSTGGQGDRISLRPRRCWIGCDQVSWSCTGGYISPPPWLANRGKS